LEIFHLFQIYYIFDNSFNFIVIDSHTAKPSATGYLRIAGSFLES